MFSIFKKKKSKPSWDDVACFDLSFLCKKLNEEYAWPEDYAAGGIEEYRKFMFLISQDPSAGHTPSQSVDKVWQIHLQYTKNYWKSFCKLLGTEVHHNPGDGSPSKEKKFKNDYRKTLDRYRGLFGEPPRLYWGVHQKSSEKELI